MNDFFLALRKVYSKISYVFLALIISFLTFVVVIWFPNISFIRHTASTLTFGKKVNFLVMSLGAINTNFTLFSKATIILFSILAGMDISMLIFYFRFRIKKEKALGSSFWGVFFSLLGVGCASCGSVILTSILGLSLSNTVLRFLPFGGHELSVLGLIFLFYSIYLLSKKIVNPLVCKIN